MQAKVFPDFETLRAAGHLGAETDRRFVAKTRAIGSPVLPTWRAKDDKSVRMRLLELFQPRIKNLFTPAAIEVHICADVGLVQARDQRIDGFFAPVSAKLAQMIVGINNRKGRSFDVGLLAHQLGYRT